MNVDEIEITEISFSVKKLTLCWLGIVS